MTKIVLDRAASSRLEHVAEQTELCDESGRTLGLFVPVANSKSELYAWAHAQFSDEELDNARKELGELTIGQVLEGLAES